MNKIIIVLLVIVAIAAFAFYQYAPKTISNFDTGFELNQCQPQPSTCNGNMLTLYRCVNNVSTEFQYNCAELSDNVNNWTCNPQQTIVQNNVQITRANCDVVQEQSSANNSGEQTQQNVNVSTNQSNATTVENSPLLAYCGNAIIDNEETCTSCPSDFKCSTTQQCDAASGICKEKNTFGDDKCTVQEKQRGTDCLACGCSTRTSCNQISKRCEPSAILTASGVTKINEIVANYTIKYNYTLVSSSDVIYEGTSAKLISINCNPSETFFCRMFIIVDKNGIELGRFQTI